MKKILGFIILQLCTFGSFAATATHNVTFNASAPAYEGNQAGSNASTYPAGSFCEAIRQSNISGSGTQTIRIVLTTAAPIGSTNPASWDIAAAVDTLIIDGSGSFGGFATITAPGYGAWSMLAKRLVLKNVVINGGFANSSIITLSTNYNRIINSTVNFININFNGSNNTISNSNIIDSKYNFSAGANTITGSTFSNDSPVNFQTASPNNVITNCTFKNASPVAITGATSTGNQFTGNTFQNASTLTITNGGTNTISNGAFQNNTFITISGGTTNKIYGNYFNLNTAGTALSDASIPAFITITGSTSNEIGGSGAGQGNVFGAISSVTNYVVVSGTSTGLKIVNNYFGTEKTGANLLGNLAGSGILLTATTTATVDGNVILGSAVDKAALELAGTTSGLNVKNNKIGINAAGVYAIGTIYGNNGSGIAMYAGTLSSSTIDNNNISSNKQHGISLEGTTTTVGIINNIVGLKGTGVKDASNDYGNGFTGIRTFGAGTVTALTIDNNVVCDNGKNSTSPSFQAETVGIIMNGTTVASVTISNNYVGVDKSHNLAGNVFTGIYLFQNGAMGGGTQSNVVISGNVIGDNGETAGTVINSHGIAVYSSQNFQILNNYIGIGTGGQNIGNSANGIELNTSANNFLISGNRISNNKGRRTSAESETCAGIVSFNSTNGVIINNTITNNLNAGAGWISNNGVAIQRGGSMRIGGTAAGEPNTISTNGMHGIIVFDGADNVEIRRNVIQCNAKMGISLNVASDPGDTPTQTKGVGNSSMTSGPTLVIGSCPGGSASGSGTVSGTSPGSNSLIEVFSTPACKDCQSAVPAVKALRGEATAFQQQVTATTTTWTASGVGGDVSVTATTPTGVTVGGNTYRITSRFSNCEPCSLPVELLSFTATNSNGQAVLNWATAQEKNSSHFIVERSVDGKSFSAVDQVKAAGYSARIVSYSYIDNTPLADITYYRLRLVDNDGTSAYSDVRFVVTDGGVRMRVLPNPSNGVFSVQVSAPGEEILDLTVIDVVGKLIYKKKLNVLEGSVIEDIDLYGIEKGVYIININGTNVKTIEKLVIE